MFLLCSQCWNDLIETLSVMRSVVKKTYCHFVWISAVYIENFQHVCALLDFMHMVVSGHLGRTWRIIWRDRYIVAFTKETNSIGLPSFLQTYCISHWHWYLHIAHVYYNYASQNVNGVDIHISTVLRHNVNSSLFLFLFYFLFLSLRG